MIGTALAQGTSIGAPQDAATPLHEKVAMPATEAVTDDGWTAGDLVQENPDLKGFGARLRPR